ncbi:hypothetical protein [Actinospica robiniae]|uniref:hypothetical protein n=1 Tax=Actinospica robiniae TaxID=304901 RepID=UPI00040FB2DF|nr:hypothetical protein [Actinospica robiniae]
MKTRFKHTSAAGLATAAILTGALVAAAGPAQAASQSQAAAICGSGYYPVAEVPLSNSIIYVSYNGSTDCAVNIKTAFVGTPTSTYVYLFGPNGSWGGNADNGAWDGGSYSYYAGPVYTYAPHECVDFGGGDGVRTYDTDEPTLCG